jgi:hypothetical protein
MYDPAMGRFYQTDPVASDPNPYAYALGDPVNLTDPLGQMVYTVPLPGGGFRIFGDSGPYSTEGTGNPGVGDCEDYDVVGGGDQAPGLSFGINGGGSKSATESKPQSTTCAAALRTAGQTSAAVARANSSMSTLPQAASANGIDPALLAAIVVRESGFQDIPEAGGGAGMGVFQLTNQQGVTSAQAYNGAFAANYAASMISSNMIYLANKFPTLTPSQLLQATAAS